MKKQLLLFGAALFILSACSSEDPIEKESTTIEESTIEETEEVEVKEEKKEPALTERTKDEFTELTEEQLEGMKRKPDEHADDLVKFSGKVIQIIPGEVEFEQFVRLAINDNYDDVVLIQIVFPNEIETGNLLEDDFITVYGKFNGLNTYESTSGKPVTLPYFSASGKVIELMEGE